MSKKKAATTKAVPETGGYDTKSVAAAVVRFLALLPDDFSLVAEDPYDSELSQISFGLYDWCSEVLGREGCEKAEDTSLFQKDDEA